MTTVMRQWADFSLEGGEGEARALALSGRLRVYTIGDLDARLERVDEPIGRVDIAGVDDMDTTGAWLVYRFARDRDAEIVGESEQARRLIKAVSSFVGDETAAPATPDLLSRTLGEVGDMVIGFGQGFVRVVGFLGATIASMGSLILHPRRFRGKALVRQMQLVGVNSLWIIGLMSFLIGIVIAQQGAVQLQQFGAEIYTINLTGRLSIRELGVLMTSIMVAGRSGSAFAAQIGTMRLTEEVDAMRTIGVSPMEALVVPRILAAMLMLPLLGFYSSVIAIIGGASISAVALDIPFFTFLSRIQEVVPAYDLWVGLVKAPVFGLIVALAGCYHGMQVKGNAEEVGQRTTQAVVTAIFTVIVLDAFFAVFFTEIGWA